MPARYWEEFSAGESFGTEPVRIREADMIGFARRYDPQPFHTDREAAKAGAYGGLIASGHHTIAIGFAQFIRLGLFAENSLGGPAMDEVRWLAPVRPGDLLETAVEVLETRPSASRPDRGLVRLQFSMRVRGGEVARFRTATFVRRRPAGEAA